MTERVEEPEAAQKFKDWFVASGGSFHPHVHYTPVNSGYSITTSEVLEPDAIVASCPFSLAVTPALSRSALSALLDGDDVLKDWTERQLVCCYIAFHWIVDVSSFPSLAHRPYIDTLPSHRLLRTPLHFTDAELEALRGSNMYGATLDRRKDWQEEWLKCQSDIAKVNVGWAEGLTWDRYLTASTYLSSRAFPSTLLSYAPSLVQTQESHPVLLPGVDSLNHARANPVSWLIRSDSSSVSSPNDKMSVCLQTHTLYPAGVEVFNNYGPKPNAELLLGYGFTLPHNPDDTLVLKLGGPNASGKRWEIGRNARGVEGLWAEILETVRSQPREDADEDEEEPPTWSLMLDASEILDSLSTTMMERLPNIGGSPSIRSDVAVMLDQYKEAEALALAKEDGVDIQME
ncbi:unnamed protein product [Peniophora sp. CBMAI 1063]|nr:unnamed protein product [Peniophora sp. CBMAI 1063]